MKTTSILLLFLLPILNACNAKMWANYTTPGYNVSISNSSITATSGITANGVATATITITLLDSNSNPVTSVVPQFDVSGGGNILGTCSATDATGVSLCTLKSTVAQTKTLTLTSPKVISGGTTTFVPGPISPLTSTITATTPVLADGVSDASIQVTLYDANYNPIPLETPTVSSTGSLNVIGACSATNFLGIATCSFTSIKAEVKTLSLDSPITLSGAFAVTFSPGAIDAANSDISATQNIVANGTDTSTVTIRLIDANFNKIVGVMPTFTATDTGATNRYFACSLSDLNGTSVCTMSSKKAEVKTISLTGITGTVFHIVTFIPGAPSTIKTTIVGTSPINAGSFSTVTITILDDNSNPIANITPDFVVSGTSNSLPSCSLTDASGVSTCSFSSTKAETKSLSLTSPISISNASDVIFVPEAVDATTSSISGIGPILADGIQSSAITIYLYDVYNNPVSGKNVSFSSTGSNNTISTCTVTDIDGLSTCSLKSTTAETKTISISSPISASTANVVFNNLTPDAANSSMSITPYAVADGADKGVVTITLRDVSNIPVENYTPTISATGANTIIPCSSSDSSGVSTCAITSLELGLKSVDLTSAPLGLNGKITFAIKPFIYTWRISSPGDSHTLGVVSTRSYNFAVDWGDGTTSEITSGIDPDITHAYTSSGSYDVKLFPLNITGISQLKFTTVPANLESVNQWGNNQWSDMTNMFYNCVNLDVKSTDAPNLSGVTSLSGMFYGATNLVGNSSFNSWGTASITNMNSLFFGAIKFNQNIGLWETRQVQSMIGMFRGATLFNNGDTPGNSASPLVNWGTDALTTMQDMFRSASSFNQNIGAWNVSNVTSLYRTFMSASSFNQDLSGWNVSSVESMYYTFFGATNFNNGDDLDPLTPASKPMNWFWGVSKNLSLNSTFYLAVNFNQNIGLWDTQNVMTMAALFTGAKEFNNGCARTVACNPLNWNTAKVKNMSNLFNGATYFNQILPTWNFGEVVTTASMFEDATNFNQAIVFSTPKLVYMTSMFENAKAFDRDLNSMNTNLVISMARVFYGASAFTNRGTPLTWITSNVTSMTSMFRSAGYTLTVASFDTTQVQCYENFNTGTPGLVPPSWARPQAKCRYTYVTTSQYNGNLGGVTGADAKCMSDTAAPNTGTYKALIQGGVRNRSSPDWPITLSMITYIYRQHATAEYYDAPTSTYVPIYPQTWITASNFPLGAATLSTPLIKPFLDPANSKDFWTGLDDGWGNNNNCNDWTSNNVGDLGYFSTSDDWLNTTTGCDQLKHLFCIEQ